MRKVLVQMSIISYGLVVLLLFKMRDKGQDRIRVVSNPFMYRRKYLMSFSLKNAMNIPLNRIECGV